LSEFFRSNTLARQIPRLREKASTILPHRERIVKNLENESCLDFVCAMWLTGFDAPICSMLYLDKPMRGHTLMQTIARLRCMARR
jgi:type I restriction enzyme R subunit